MENPKTVERTQQQMLQPTANSHRLLSPTDDDKVFPPPFMPDELIENILLRLPVCYLLQLRFVCKLWKTLISNPKFAEKHLLCSTSDQSMNHKRLACAFGTYPEKIVSYPLNSLFGNPLAYGIPDSFSGLNRDDKSYKIIGSCNGLFCLSDICLLRSFILYNPSIRLKSKKSPKYASNDWFIMYNGFGYDQVNGKYKVLLSLYGETSTKIYTFGEDSWRTIPNSPCTPSPIQAEGKCMSGTLNWVSYKRHVDSYPYMILSFDLEKETYREVLLPQNVGDNYKCSRLLYVLSNCLCMRFVSQTHSVVWLMKEYGVVESWTKLMIIPHVKFNLNHFLDVLFISENGFVLIVNTSKESSQFILYNINSGELDFPSISSNRVFGLHIYHESLISPPRW